MKDLNGPFGKICINTRNVLRNEKGQTLIEHGLLLGLSSSIGITQNHLIIFLAVIGLILLILLLLKPRVLIALIIIAALTAASFFVYRWVKYGHL
jgi:Flp pilus assembly pilin Flp